MNLPTVERHYLTREGDMVDAICWAYYGFTEIATEAVYNRNPFLSTEQPLLPGMLLIVLPVVTEDQLQVRTRFWPSVPRKLYVPGGVAAADASTFVNPNGEETCCSNNVAEVEDADYVAVYIPNEIGDWVLRKIHKNKLFPSSIYGALTLDDDPAIYL